MLPKSRKSIMILIKESIKIPLIMECWGTPSTNLYNGTVCLTRFTRGILLLKINRIKVTQNKINCVKNEKTHSNCLKDKPNKNQTSVVNISSNAGTFMPELPRVKSQSWSSCCIETIIRWKLFNGKIIHKTGKST